MIAYDHGAGGIRTSGGSMIWWSAIYSAYVVHKKAKLALVQWLTVLSSLHVLCLPHFSQKTMLIRQFNLTLLSKRSQNPNLSKQLIHVSLISCSHWPTHHIMIIKFCKIQLSWTPLVFNCDPPEEEMILWSKTDPMEQFAHKQAFMMPNLSIWLMFLESGQV